MNIQCVVYNATGPIQVRWYHSQNRNPAEPEELNTTGGRYTVEESEQSHSNDKNCSADDSKLYQNALKFNYTKADSGSYWCRIVIGGDILIELSEAWTVSSNSGQATCGPGPSQTDPKCAGQITPILASTTLLVQSTPTSVVGATSKLLNAVTQGPVQTRSPVQTPSASSTLPSTLPSVTTGCMLGGVSCFVYLGAGLGALVVIVVLLVLVVIVLVHISVKIQKKKRKGERENTFCLCVVVFWSLTTTVLN